MPIRGDKEDFSSISHKFVLALTGSIELHHLATTCAIRYLFQVISQKPSSCHYITILLNNLSKCLSLSFYNSNQDLHARKVAQNHAMPDN